MDKAEDIFVGRGTQVGFLQLCLEAMCPDIEAEIVESKCNEYRRLFGLLDAVWSSVRGVDAGLLPTPEQITILANALDAAKVLWIKMGLSTLQPKWHLTFDGHLLAQFTKFGGLADKSDETIEKGHQTLKKLRDRYRGVSSYSRRETCIRRELRRQRSPEIEQEIKNYEAAIKQKRGTRRQIDATARQETNKRAKLEKRVAYITS